MLLAAAAVLIGFTLCQSRAVSPPQGRAEDACADGEAAAPSEGPPEGAEPPPDRGFFALRAGYERFLRLMTFLFIGFGVFLALLPLFGLPWFVLFVSLAWILYVVAVAAPYLTRLRFAPDNVRRWCPFRGWASIPWSSLRFCGCFAQRQPLFRPYLRVYLSTDEAQTERLLHKRFGGRAMRRRNTRTVFFTPDERLLAQLKGRLAPPQYSRILRELNRLKGW